ncbi:MAG: hypothetical protein H7301_00460 [Cryobacterium sp.]|nr:hypothetical protein [Oligoflexia bacterium]
MRLWKTPGRLRRIAATLLAVIPLTFAAYLLARRMPWWRWDWEREGRYWISGSLFTLLLCAGLFRRSVAALLLVSGFSAVFPFLCLLYSVRHENVGLGLLSVALGLLAFGYLDRLWAAFDLPALSPGIRWYQGSPEPIPGLSLDWGDYKNLRVSKLDLESGFILGNFEIGSEKNLPSEITFYYRGSQIACGVRLVSALPSKIHSAWAGIGVEFKNTDRDSRKDLADFIEVLRGEGHVSS